MNAPARSILGPLGAALLLPLHAAALLTRAKSFEANPLLGSRRLNRAGLHAARVELAWNMAARRRRRLAALVSPEDRAAFDRDGFVLCEEFLAPGQFEQLLAELRAYRCTSAEIVQGETLNRKFPVGPAVLAAAPTLRELLGSPRWRGLIRYAGSRDADPSVFVQTLIRQGGTLPRDPQTRLHADTFHPTVKAWLFLTDVAEDAGAFTYVPGSHRLTAERLAWERRQSLEARSSPDRETREGSFRIVPEELAALRLPPPQILAVRANTLVVADTFGFHARGPSPRPSARVEIWAYGPRSPFVPWTGPGLWSSMGLARRAAILDGLERAASRIGLAPRSSHRHRKVSAFDGPAEDEPPGAAAA